MSAQISALETNQTDFRHQLSKVLMTSQNNEQALKANTMTLNNLATMVTIIMDKLESKTMVRPLTHTCDNEACNPRSALKSVCENQAQSKQVRIGTSSALPIDVVDVSYVPSEDEKPRKQFVRLTRSKDVKFKGVSEAQDNSEVGMKGHRSEKVSKKTKVTRGGACKGCGTEDATGHVTSA